MDKVCQRVRSMYNEPIGKKGETMSDEFFKDYENIMQQDWNYRHSEEMREKLGVWRWKGMYEYQDYIKYLLNKAQTVIDVGGALGPLGFGSIIVDKEKKSIWGQNCVSGVPKKLYEKIDMVFSSHYLEHRKYIKEQIAYWYCILKQGGHLILHVPSIKGAEYWHPDVKPKHEWCFALMETTIQDLSKTVYLDSMVAKHFKIKMAKYCGDCSIMIIAQKSN